MNYILAWTSGSGKPVYYVRTAAAWSSTYSREEATRFPAEEEAWQAFLDHHHEHDHPECERLREEGFVRIELENEPQLPVPLRKEAAA